MLGTGVKRIQNRSQMLIDAPCMIYLPLFGYIWVSFGVILLISIPIPDMEHMGV